MAEARQRTCGRWQQPLLLAGAHGDGSDANSRLLQLSVQRGVAVCMRSTPQLGNLAALSAVHKTLCKIHRLRGRAAMKHARPPTHTTPLLLFDY